MKRTFTINIGGRVFHTEEDAFEKLQKYLQLLSHYFGNQAGGQEILQDIESRIAELLQEKITDGKEAITSEWVDELIHRMGTPEDFGDTEQAGNAGYKAEKTKKRMYRDGENRVLGGVCSGMSTYFNLDPVILRILFVLLFFVGAGTSAIIYLILWIVVPKARTTAQRLEMRGEDATVSNIRKTIQEEVKEVKDRVSGINKSDVLQKSKKVVNKAGLALAQAFKGLGKTLSGIFGSLLIVIGFIGFVTIMVSLAIGSSVIHGNLITQEVDFTGFLDFVVSPGLVNLYVLLAVLLFGIPLLAVLFVGTKLVFRYHTNNKLIGLGAFGIWLAALILAILITVGQVRNFSQENTMSSGNPLNCPASQTLCLQLGDIPENAGAESTAKFDDFMAFSMNGKKIAAGIPHLQIETTDATDFSVIIRKESRGKNANEVQANLKNIQYSLTSGDSTLVLDPFFTIGKQSKWRNQEVQIIVKVPSGKSVHLAENLGRLHFDFDNINNIQAREMTGKTWIMTPEGLSLKK